MKKLLSRALLGLALGYCSLAQAAEVSVSENFWGAPVVYLEGKIVKGDLEKVKKFAKIAVKQIPFYTNYSLELHLNTKGGDVSEALKIGRFVRSIVMKTSSEGNSFTLPGSALAKQKLVDCTKQKSPN